MNRRRPRHSQLLRRSAAIVALLLPVVATAVPLPVPMPLPPRQSAIVGGWAPASVGDAQVIAASHAAMAQRSRFSPHRAHHRTPRLVRIDNAEAQVVAGTNYRLMLTLSDRSHWQAIVWRRLDGTFTLTEWAAIN